jgi:hypothetical protein
LLKQRGKGKFFLRPILAAAVIIPLILAAAANAVVVVPPTWTQTSQADFNTSTLFQTDTATSPNDVMLAKANNGFVYAFEGNSTKLFWRYNISSNNWTSLHDAPQTVGAGGALAYDGGNYIYALGGSGCNYFWRYNISTNSWDSLPVTLGNVNTGGALVYTGGDYLYAFQGNGNKVFWRYSISGNVWAGTPTVLNCPTAINGGAALTYNSGNNLIYALCGQAKTFYQYSISANTWTALTNTPDTIGDGGSLATDGSNYVYALKGNNTVTYWRYNISSPGWTQMADTPATPCVYGGGALVYDKSGSFYALRGYSHTDYWKYSTVSNNWTTLHDTPANVDYGGALAYQSPTYYASGTLTSSTFDPGWAADWNSIYWTAVTPAGTTLRFQIATNTDNATWNFKGPDGTSSTYYTTSYATIWSGHSTDRFIRYKVYFDTTNNVVTPTLNDISITYNRHIYVPTATTNAGTAVEETTATLNGAVASDGGELCQYQFNYGTVSGNYTVSTGWSGNVSTGQSYSYNATSLTQGTTYYYRAQLKNSKGTGSDGELTFLTKPEAPTSLTAASANSSQINLSWVKGTGANRTKVLRKTGSYPANYNDGTQVNFNTGTSAVDSGLSANTTYYYRAWSEVTAGSLQQWSDNYVSATASTSGAPTASTLPVTALDGTTATLNGSVVTDGSELCQYRFVYGTAAGGPYPNNTGWAGSLSSGQTFSSNLTGLAKGTLYYYVAQVKNSAGTGSDSELSFLTKPDAPSSFTAVTANSTSAVLNWIEGPGALRTIVVRNTAHFPANRSDGDQVYFNTGTSFTNAGLSANTTYYYRAWSEVTAGSLQQWSDNYASASLTTGSAPTANAFDATGVEETTATLHGSVITDGGELCQYQFVYGNVQGGPYPNSTGWTGNVSAGQTFSLALTGLGKGTPYYYEAQVRNSTGIGSSPEIHFLTKPDPPADDSFSAGNTDYTSITLTWVKGEGAVKTYVLRKIGSYSDNRDDGVLVYFDTGTTFTDTGLNPNTVYYYTAWSWAVGSEQWSNGFRATVATAAPSTPPPPTTPASVGGIVFPIDKMGILMPYLAIGGILLLMLGGAALKLAQVRRRNGR